MKPTLIACKLLKALRQADSPRSALLTALLLAPLAAPSAQTITHAEADISPKDYYDQAVYRGLTSKMRAAPCVHKAFCQDAFKTQLDRHPKDPAGNPVPSIELEDGERVYRLPRLEVAR